MTINERIKTLRKSIGLTQDEFRQKIGMSKGGFSELESGKIGLSGSVKKSILREFNVNPIWLDSGAGEMFFESTEESDLEAFFGQVLGADQEDIRKRICKVLARIPHECWDQIADIAEQIAAEEEAKAQKKTDQ